MSEDPSLKHLRKLSNAFSFRIQLNTVNKLGKLNIIVVPNPINLFITFLFLSLSKDIKSILINAFNN